MWSNLSNYIVELMLVALAIFWGKVYCPLRIISYLCDATGRKNTRSRKVVHLYKKIWTIF